MDSRLVVLEIEYQQFIGVELTNFCLVPVNNGNFQQGIRKFYQLRMSVVSEMPGLTVRMMALICINASGVTNGKVEVCFVFFFHDSLRIM